MTEPIQRKIEKVLIANRGEIAVRIIKTLDAMGINSVAVCSRSETGTRHARLAGECIVLEGESLGKTYLNIPHIVAVAQNAGVDAIHPGYGFLSESAAFSSAVRKAGMVFIGPNDEAIRLMGNKVEARQLAADLGIPVVQGAVGADEQLFEMASSIGYPLLVKAAAGGGGKGMRIVYNHAELHDVLETTRREALSYFGNDQIYIEKYLENPRHVEVQLIADEQGNIVCLYDRECSVQRRYQKIIEEAPAPGISQSVRNQMMEAARIIARKIDYLNAGTVEFLVKDDNWYFLEMNTRIQVEHPVTEMITGVDIVSEQMRVACGMPLSFTQQSLSVSGHAIEARIYAEDPSQNFMPNPGKVILYREPNMSGVRIDSSLDGCGEISREYDPMISKVIAHGRTRDEALELLSRALREYVIHGVRTNIPFLIHILDSSSFRSGEVDTGFCDRLAFPFKEKSHNNPHTQALLLSAYLFASRIASQNPHCTDQVHTANMAYAKKSVWQELGYWRIAMNPSLVIDDKTVSLSIISANNGSMIIDVLGKHRRFDLLFKNHQMVQIRSEGEDSTFYFSVNVAGRLWMQKHENIFLVGLDNYFNEEEVNRQTQQSMIDGIISVNAPMHGKIIKVNVNVKDIVNKGDTLLVLESMKMENKILSPGKATISSIHVAAGDVVSNDAPLVLLTNGG